MRIKVEELEIGDILSSDGAIVTEVNCDIEGVWLVTDKDDGGYLDYGTEFLITN